jgi:hypothetical protein
MGGLQTSIQPPSSIDVALVFLFQHQAHIHDRGRPLFQPTDVATRLRLAETRAFGNGVVLLRYERPHA